jgi:1,4-dihydroxy-2-naphthoate octaprenyltransferase
LAIRPRTLSLSAIPVLAGSALAWHDGVAVNWAAFLVALLCALLIQAGTNLFNDASDAERGNDGPGRKGPQRVTGSGLASARAVRRAAWSTFGFALLGGLYLVVTGGGVILGLGLASLLAGWAYSGGPRPLSYTAWGEVFVILFFGLTAVGGSYYLQSGTISAAALVVGFALGLHAAAVLLVNNVRDYEDDRRVGRKTLVSVISPQRAQGVYTVLMLAPFLLIAAALGPGRLGAAWLALPVCVWLAWRFGRIEPDDRMNSQLGLTAQAQLLLGGLVAVTLMTGYHF